MKIEIENRKVVEEHNKDAFKYDSNYEGIYNEYENELELDILLKYLPKNKKIKILDAAGGTGRLAIPLAEKGYSNIYCVDLADNMLRIGKKKVVNKKMTQKIEFIKEDVTNLKRFEENYFDFTFCFGTALSYCDPKKALKEFKRVTKPKGFIIVDFKSFYRNLGMLIQTKDKLRIKELIEKGIYSSKYHSYKEKNFKMKDIKKLMKDSKLKLIKMMGKNTLYQYFSKMNETNRNNLLRKKENKKYFLDIDRKMREDINFIPLSLEIVAVLKKIT